MTASAPGAPEQLRRTIGASFSGTRNSLNFLRLVLATLVLVDHSVGLAGFGSLWTLNDNSIGTLAVYGFFGISGFLIAGSAVRNTPVRYLWQRFLRIFPGLWVCLIMTALVFGVIAYVADPIGHCGLSCYVYAPDGPVKYVYRNALLPNAWLYQFSIGGTPKGVPYPAVWDGPLWTLFYEFLCYLGLLALGLTGFLKRRVLTLVSAVLLWGGVAVITLTPRLDSRFNFFHNAQPMNLLKFAAIFMVGSVLYLYRDRVPDSGWLALATAALFFAGLFLPNGGFHDARNPVYWFTDSYLLVPVIAYPLLWLGIHLPFHRLGARNDYSYGVYIYAYPMTQLLAVAGVQHWGYPAFLILSILVTAPVAVASWWIVERHALRLKKINLRRSPRPAAVPAATDADERELVDRLGGVAQDPSRTIALPETPALSYLASDSLSSHDQ